MVSKSTSGMQTEEHQAYTSKPQFTLPDVLMLDSYTQTNEEDRLKTKLITHMRPTAHVQTDSAELSLPKTDEKPSLSKKVSFSLKSQQEGLTATQNENLRTNAKTEPDPKHLPISFNLEQMCRHGSERSTCIDCNKHIVHKRHPSQTRVSSIPIIETPQARAINSSLPAWKEEEKDSGQESDTCQSPRLTNMDLAKIKDLAKAKLKQIKRSEPQRVSRTLDKSSFLPSISPADAQTDTRQNDTTLKKQRRPKPKNYGGIESLTLQDLPTLAERKGFSEESSDENEVDRVRRFLRNSEELHEKKREGEVKKAKKFIKQCINSPLDADHSCKHNYRKRESLPQINDKRRCDSEATNRRNRGIADDVESRKCVSEVPSGKMRPFDVNFKAYINALTRIVGSSPATLTQADGYTKK